jgi:hypothetical protein
VIYKEKIIGIRKYEKVKKKYMNSIRITVYCFVTLLNSSMTVHVGGFFFFFLGTICFAFWALFCFVILFYLKKPITLIYMAFFFKSVL